jgi:hypothetical protein
VLSQDLADVFRELVNVNAYPPGRAQQILIGAIFVVVTADE